MPTIDRSDLCDPRENFRIMGPRGACPCGPQGLAKNLHARVLCPCGPTRLTWPSPCGPHSHAHTTTRSCLAHDHSFIKHMVVSHARPTTQPDTPLCGVDRMLIRLSPKLDFLHFGNTTVTVSMRNQL
ncbi:hypothetical protein PVK06_002813 [Gossypium arboreum]|uniref:Uncharacterized protein n=1 Tax=Gossypium arboreum TaxID=29729 RepID=A0ABR0R4L8_GOSAR|nr:hypothetical protein PVK06_002813 [Gossypium arboreum]